MMARRRVCSTAVATTRRALSYYDSQSGQHIDVNPAPRLYELSGGDESKTNAVVWHRVASLEDVAKTEARGISYEIEATEREFATAMASASRDRGLEQHVVVKRALDVDPLRVQLLAADLADRSARTIVLSSPQVNEDALEELVDLLGEVDVEGLPMRRRLGLRLPPHADVDRLCDFASTTLGISSFDVSHDGTQGPETALVATAASRSLPTPFDVILIREYSPL